jgi:exosortase B
MSVNSLKSRLITGAAPLARAENRRRRIDLIYLGAMAASFFIAYSPTYVTLAKGAWQTEQEGHGPLIMLAAAWLAWQQRGKPASTALKPAPLAGWTMLLSFLALMAVARSQNIVMLEVATQIPILLGCLLLFGGWPLARIFAFPLAFLIFAVPPPGWMMDALTVPLKTWISDLVSNFLYALDYPIAQNGVIIMIGTYELMVKDACSGINSIFALSAIGIFYAREFVHNDWIRRLILILSIVPITIVANLLRVLALVLGAYYFGADRIEGLFHDLTGIALFVFALVLFFLLDSIMISVGFLVRKGWASSRALARP